MDKVIKTVLGFSSKSLNNEMIDIFSGNTELPSASALVQQRSKILPSAFEDVFKQFINTMNPIELFDGSDIRTPINPNDPDSYYEQGDSKPYNLYHLNALYDLLSHTYFRSLKYTIGLLYFHSKKPGHIIQGIFAKLTMYNFSELIAAGISIRNAARNLLYRINFSASVNVCRKFFPGFCTPDFVEAVIQKNLLPIRSLKSKPGLHKSKSAVSFLYRIA